MGGDVVREGEKIGRRADIRGRQGVVRPVRSQEVGGGLPAGRDPLRFWGSIGQTRHGAAVVVADWCGCVRRCVRAGMPVAKHKQPHCKEKILAERNHVNFLPGVSLKSEIPKMCVRLLHLCNLYSFRDHMKLLRLRLLKVHGLVKHIA